MFKTITRLLFRISEYIAELKVKYQLKNIEVETDSQAKLEKQIVYKISGVSLGGMASSSAFVEFKSTFYDCITSPSEKKLVEMALVNILKSTKYSLRIQAKVSYVCADIRLVSALQDVEDLLRRVKEGTSEQRLVLRSLEALYSNVSMTDKNNEEVVKKGI